MRARQVIKGPAFRALLAGCRAVVPNAGAYPEMLGAPDQSVSFYEPNPAELAAKLGAALDAGSPPLNTSDWRRRFKAFDAISACRLIDERLEQLAATNTSARLTG